MSTINTIMGRYSFEANNAGDLIKGAIAINDEGGAQLTRQEFSEHNLDDVINNVIFPVTGGNRLIANAIREQMIKAGFAQLH